MTNEEKEAASKADIDKMMIIVKNYSKLLIIGLPSGDNQDTILLRKIGDNQINFIEMIASALYQDRRLLMCTMQAIDAVIKTIDSENSKEEGT